MLNYIPGFKAISVIGGRDISEDRRRLSKCKAIVATLGRLLHLINNCVISVQQIQLIVLDEADKLITSDFRSNIDKLFKMFPVKPQVIASSATYANGLDKLLLKYMQNPAAVSVTHGMPILIGIKQFLHFVTDNDSSNNEVTVPTIKMMMCKVDAIENILKRISFKQCIIFSNSQMRAESFFKYLTEKGWKADLIIGSHEQQRRTSTFQKFCKFESRILIASDVIARGIDVENVNLVINLDVPIDSSTYLHRIGRCGRFGTYGIAITLITDNMDMNRFEKMLANIGADGIKVPRLPLINELDNSRLWDFCNKNSDESLFYEIDTATSGREGSGKFCDIPPNVIESNERGVCPQHQNMELLQLSKLMLENRSENNVQVDLDLFTDYTNLDATSDVEINTINGKINTIESDTDVILHEKPQHIDEMIAVPNAEHFQNRAFLQAVNKLHIQQPPYIVSPTNVASTSKTEIVTEENPNSIKMADILRKNVTKEYCSVRKPKLTAQNHWQNIYWQQFKQINQYFCWAKSNFPSK